MTRAYLLVRHRRGGRTSDEPPAPCALSPAASYVDSCPASTPSPPHHTLHIIQVPCLLSCLMHARPCKARRCSRAARGQWCDEQERGPIMGRISSAPTQKDPCFQQLSSPMHFKPLCSSMCLKRATKNKPQPHTLPLQHAHRPRSTRSLPRSAQGRQIDRWCEPGAWACSGQEGRFLDTPCFYIHRTVKFITHRCFRHIPGSNDTLLVVDRIQNVSLMLTTPLAFRLAVTSGGIPNRRSKRTTLPSVR